MLNFLWKENSYLVESFALNSYLEIEEFNKNLRTLYGGFCSFLCMLFELLLPPF